MPRLPSMLPIRNRSMIGFRDSTTLSTLVCSKIEQSFSLNSSNVEARYVLQPRFCSSNSNRSANCSSGIRGITSSRGGGNMDSAAEGVPFSCIFNTFLMVPSISSRLDTDYAPALRPLLKADWLRLYHTPVWGVESARVGLLAIFFISC